MHELTDRVLRALAEGRAADGRQDALGAGGSTGLALAAVADFWLGEFADATAHAAAALTDADGIDERALALAAAALARAGDATSTLEDPLPELIGIFTRSESGSALALHLAGEAALCSARLGDASVLDALPVDLSPWDGHPFAYMMLVRRVRVAAFTGRINDAHDLLGPVRAAASGRLTRVVSALESLVLGNADDSTAAAHVRLADELTDDPADFVDRGVLLLHAFGAIAIGDTAAAAALTLRAGGGAGLDRCTIIDRALGLELLAVAAQAGGDLEAMSAWCAQASVLGDHPIAEPTVNRLLARLALEQGDPHDAVRRAEASVAACRASQRMIEAAEGEIVLARARIEAAQVSAAVRGLRELVSQSDLQGHRAVRRSAGDALRPARRRLPPVVGSGWSALSAREAEVGQLVLEGLEIAEIARRLQLSRHTVRVHVSRVLAAFGVASRIGLLTATGSRGGHDRVLRPLTMRQEDVVSRAAAGLGNQQIADALGVSIKTVEKHVADAMDCWDTRSRFELARLWLIHAGHEAVS